MEFRYTILLIALFLDTSSAVTALWTSRSVQKFHSLMDELKMRGEIPSQLSKSREKKAKRSRCLINAGLSQGCDLSDVLNAKMQASKFSSFAGPGKR